MKTWKRWQWATKDFQDFSGISWNSLDASALHAHLESPKLGQRPPHGHESLTPDLVRSRRVCESLNLLGCRWMSRLQEFQYVPILTGYSVPPYVALRSFHLQDWKDWCQEWHDYAVCPNVSWSKIGGWVMVIGLLGDWDMPCLFSHGYLVYNLSRVAAKSVPVEIRVYILQYISLTSFASTCNRLSRSLCISKPLILLPSDACALSAKRRSLVGRLSLKPLSVTMRRKKGAEVGEAIVKHYSHSLSSICSQRC